ncbi:TagF domain-containing protein [Aliiroseovarius sp. YM-037]|uniref:TagF domain-containing protein n=1 Tax=Aliiroseovarius sp. YM-037 TaxID=3341728 RepID=UPI003A80FA41
MVGFFGKLPSTGDFVARGLPPGLRPVLDQWLTRNVVGGLPLDRGLPDNGIRLVMAREDGGFAALILPSHDKLGREYPFAIIGMMSDGAPSIVTADGWCDAVLPAARKVIDTPLPPDQALEALAQISVDGWVADPDQSGCLIWVKGTDPIGADGATAADAVAQMAVSST